MYSFRSFLLIWWILLFILKKNLLAADPFGHQLLFNKSICLLPAVKYCGEYKCTGGGLKLELNLGNREKLDKMNFCYKVASFAFKSRCNETFSKFKKRSAGILRTDVISSL